MSPVMIIRSSNELSLLPASECVIDNCARTENRKQKNRNRNTKHEGGPKQYRRYRQKRSLFFFLFVQIFFLFFFPPFPVSPPSLLLCVVVRSFVPFSSTCYHNAYPCSEIASPLELTHTLS
jgi:hypothetical protein